MSAGISESTSITPNINRISPSVPRYVNAISLRCACKQPPPQCTTDAQSDSEGYSQMYLTELVGCETLLSSNHWHHCLVSSTSCPHDSSTTRCPVLRTSGCWTASPLNTNINVTIASGLKPPLSGALPSHSTSSYPLSPLSQGHTPLDTRTRIVTI